MEHFKSPRFRVVAVLADDLVAAFYQDTRLVWTLAKTRKAGACAVSGQEYEKGTVVFLPITNGKLRMKRVLKSVMDEKIKEMI